MGKLLARRGRRLALRSAAPSSVRAFACSSFAGEPSSTCTASSSSVSPCSPPSMRPAARRARAERPRRAPCAGKFQHLAYEPTGLVLLAELVEGEGGRRAPSDGAREGRPQPPTRPLARRGDYHQRAPIRRNSRLANLRSMQTGGSRGHEWVVKGLDSLTPVLDLDAEFILEVAAVPKQVDDDSVGLAMSELISRGQHFPPPILEMNGCTNVDPIVLERGCARIVGAPRFDPQCFGRPTAREEAAEEEARREPVR